MAEKSWRCRLGMHKWVLRSAPEAGTFHECERCGKMRTPDIRPPALGGSAAGGVG